MAALELDGLRFDELKNQMIAWGFAPAHARRLWRYIYREQTDRFEDMVELPARLRDRLLETAVFAHLRVNRQAAAPGGSAWKFLLQLADGASIETVLMRIRGRMTACISSQAGCPLGCVFCATGQMGLTRNLTASEIVAQVRFADRSSREWPGSQLQPGLRNVVVMGMGEPLLNYEAVLRALEIVSNSSGLALAAKRITISTVGVVPGITRLADEGRPYSLAVSLHAVTQAERLALIPAAAAWPLDALLEACRYYTRKLDRRIFFEWTLIAGQNDSPDQAHALAELVGDMPAHINLIPLNPTAGYAGLPGGRDSVDRFQAILREQGLPTTVRQRRGVEIAAGCGQLAGSC